MLERLRHHELERGYDSPPGGFASDLKCLHCREPAAVSSLELNFTPSFVTKDIHKHRLPSRCPMKAFAHAH